ncbi:hypothetical protein PC119_g21682 [Phytophthora cactorum]|nr:hypothetical protein PC119_g21682 [Phytophthora cactorum]
MRGSVYLDWHSQPNLRSFQELFPRCRWIGHYSDNPITDYPNTNNPDTDYPSTDYNNIIMHQRRRKWRCTSESAGITYLPKVD